MDSEPTRRRRRPGRRRRSVRVLRRARRLARFRESLVELGPDSRQVTMSDGRTLGFDDFGDPEGTPVLFFHGFGSSRVVRHPDDDIATELGARVIAVDRPGIGISTRQANRRVTDFPSDIAELLDILDIERCSIVAWSGGGPYALACAWQMPERFSVIGLISAPAPLSGVSGSTGYTWRRHRAMSRTADHAPWVIGLAMWNFSRQQKSDPEKQLDEAIAGMIEADREILGDPDLRAVMIANAAEMYRQGTGGVYDEALCLARPWGFPIEGVSVPVRIWHGSRDKVVPVGMGKYIERTVPGAVATFYRQEGHHFVYDRWREILGVLVAEARGDQHEATAEAPENSRAVGSDGRGNVPAFGPEPAAPNEPLSEPTWRRLPGSGRSP